MQLKSLAILRRTGTTVELVEAVHNLSEHSFLTRGSAKEFLEFAERTLMTYLQPGQHAVRYREHICYCFVTPEGLGCIAICDEKYPARVATMIVREQVAKQPPELQSAMVEYAKGDKVEKLRRELDDVKGVLVRTIEDVLARGEKLDDLVQKSKTLSEQSKNFYHVAKKTNRCCTIS